MKIATPIFLLFSTAFVSLFWSACKDDNTTVRIKTYPVFNVGLNSGTVRAQILNVNTDVIDFGIVYSHTSNTPKITNSPYISGETDSYADFQIELTGLMTDTLYRFRPYIQTPDSIYYGATSFFRPEDSSISTVFVPGGTYTMGATEEQYADASSMEKPAHSVTLSSFEMGTHEVTNAQFVRFLRSRNVNENRYCSLSDRTARIVLENNEKGLRYKDDVWVIPEGKENAPVTFVTWYGASEFCKWAGGHLPTEAEWEYAARGGANSNHYLYSGSNNPDEVAWYNIKGSSGKTVRDGGEKACNEGGIYDMSGNVWEWTADWYDAYPSISRALVNPTGLSDEEAEDIGIIKKVRRGGCWADTTTVNLRVSARGASAPDIPGGTLGFRFAKDASSQ